MSKRILIDAHMVGERETGNETFILNFIRGLACLNNDNRYLVGVANRSYFQSKVDLDERFTLLDVPVSPLKRIFFSLPKLARKHEIDVLVVTYAGPKVRGCKTVDMVHDVSFRAHPEWFSLKDRFVLNMGIGLSVMWSDLVVTISDHSRKELQKFYPKVCDKVCVAYLGVDSTFHKMPVDQVQTVRKKYGFERPFILTVGNLQPRKNIGRVIQAFIEQAQTGKIKGCELVVVGKAQWREDDVYELVKESSVGEMIRFTGYVPDEDLVALYNAADLFAYPSLYEGFGLPVLEAMACGAPVLTSNTTSIPEVANAAAVLVDPYSVLEIGEGLSSILENPELKNRLIERGFKNVDQFSWQKTAGEILGKIEAL